MLLLFFLQEDIHQLHTVFYADFFVDVIDVFLNGF